MECYILDNLRGGCLFLIHPVYQQTCSGINKNCWYLMFLCYLQSTVSSISTNKNWNVCLWPNAVDSTYLATTRKIGILKMTLVEGKTSIFSPNWPWFSNIFYKKYLRNVPPPSNKQEVLVSYTFLCYLQQTVSLLNLSS